MSERDRAISVIVDYCDGTYGPVENWTLIEESNVPEVIDKIAAELAAIRSETLQWAAKQVEEFAGKEIGASAAIVNIGRVRKLAERIRKGENGDL